MPDDVNPSASSSVENVNPAPEGGNEPDESNPNPNPNPDDAGGKDPNASTDDGKGKEGKPENKPNPEDGSDKDGDDEEGKDEGAPETYEDFQLPENFEPDQEALDQFKELAKEFDLSQDQAQKLIDFEVSRAQKQAEANAEYWTNLNKEWTDAAEADKEIGGNNFEANMATVHKAVEAFGTKELKQALDNTGTGNHPEFLRFFFRVGKALGDDSFHFGGGDDPAPPRSAADVLFGNNK